MTKERRTLGVTVFTFLGISGAVIAAYFATVFDWRTCYLIGGIAGIILLITRAFVMESGMFQTVKEQTHIVRGSLKMLLTNSNLLGKYIMCILVATPIWFTIGMIWTLAPELSKALGIDGIKAPIAIGVGYSGMMLGDFICGLISYKFCNRKKVIFCYLVATLAVMIWILSGAIGTAGMYYAGCFIIGLAVGYWVNFVSISAEQFGTNIRATVATSIPNFARATLLPMNLALAAMKPELGVLLSVSLLAAAAFAAAFFALWRLEETFHKDLDYCEEERILAA